MKKFLIASIAFGIMSCNSQSEEEVVAKSPENNWELETFADIRVLKYEIPAWDELDLRQKQLVYYLTQAGLAGRDITWDQFYRHNLEIRKALEKIVKSYDGNKESADWNNFMIYAKRVWFSNGIHHHYSNQKLEANFSKGYLMELMNASGASLSDEAFEVIFSDVDSKKVSKDPNMDLLTASAVNFYDSDITEEEAINFYKAQIDTTDPRPISYGLNSKLSRVDGEIVELKYSAEGLYGSAIKEIIQWLEKAKAVADNDQQAKALGLLIEYYQTGDLRKWDEYNIAWVQDTASDIDYINGFIEVYDDPIGYKATYETIVQLKDFDASKKMEVISENIQYFEDNSPIQDEHKKENVVGVSYKMINVAGEAGATTPSTPIGVNLPNANWIRTEHGSKSVSLANIENAYEHAKGAGFLEEFAFTSEEVERAKKYGDVASKMHTALHEVVGHASGKINKGVGTPKETLKNYSSTLEEARADLVALYYIVDEKPIELGLLESKEAGKAEYDSYIRNGMMLQLRRLKLGDDIEEDHMRNRQLVAGWVFERAEADKIIEKKVIDGKTYFVINDYDGLRVLFGELLREIQRIKSEGDYEAGRALVETYGVKVDQELHKEVLDRAAQFKVAPYSGFVQPYLRPVMNGEEMTDIVIEYPESFTDQMLYYGENHSFLN